MAISVDRDLNRAMAHLLLHVSERSSILDQEASEGVSQVEAEAPKTSFFESRLLVARNNVVWLDDGARMGREDQVVRDACLSRHHRGQ